MDILANTMQPVPPELSAQFENVLEFVGGIMPFLLESGTEYASLVVLQGAHALEKDIGDAAPPMPNPFAVHALALARELHSSTRRNASFVSIDPISRIETAAIRCGTSVWALSGPTRHESLGILLYILFFGRGIDSNSVVLTAHEHQDAKRIIEVFNIFYAPMHISAPRIGIPH